MTDILRLNLVFLCLSFFEVARTQSFQNRADMEKVSKPGYYEIQVTPGISSYLKTDFSDLLIEDANGKTVPYIIRSGLPVLLKDQFLPLKILSNEMSDSGKSILILNNEKHEELNGLTLLIKNAAVSRMARISGSDDRVHWYSIAENIPIERTFVMDQDVFPENISFPLSTYHYFRLIIENGKNDPLNIISAGRFPASGKPVAGPVLENPGSRFIQTDSTDRISYIRITNPESYHIDYIELGVSYPGYFKRPVAIMVRNEQYGSFTISSGTSLRFQVPVFKTRDWQIRIFNDDNPALKVVSVRTWQEPKKIILYMDSGISYRLNMTYEQAKMPHYDLQNFEDSLSWDLPAAKISGIRPVTVESGKKPFFSGKLLWPVLFGALAILLFFTSRLIKEMPGKK
jgi:hypothetical protein